MAHKDADEVPVSYIRNQHLARLLELPPDLLELIEASSAPHLAFKSAPAPLQTNSIRTKTSNPPASHVVLTANDKTYQLRQVQTSNSVLLLQAHHNGLAITAQCTSTLELEDMPSSSLDTEGRSLSASQHLIAALPLYADPADLSDQDGVPSRSAIFADIPLSDAELATAWTLLVAFETPSSHAWRPTDAVLKDLWRAVLSAATLQDIDIGAEVHASTLWDAVDTEHPRELFDALLRYLAPASRDGALRRTSTEREETYTLDPETAVAWVSRLCQADGPDAHGGQTTAQGRADEWVARCHELLPEAWHQHVRASDLEGQAMLVDMPASVVSTAAASLDTTLDAKKKADKSGATAGEKRGAMGPQRDWHARFKAAKR